MNHDILITIVVFLLVIILWKYYWKLQLDYNTTSVSLYSPVKLDEQKVSSGFDLMKKRRCVIATMVRDVSHKLDHIKTKAQKVAKLFGDSVILVVENDSLDDTREKLLEWSRSSGGLSEAKPCATRSGASRGIKILGCGVNSKECKMEFPKTDGHGVDRRRIEKMSHLRNIYLDEVKRNYHDWDYLIMWDLDTIGVVYLDGIAHTIAELENRPEVAVSCANGIYRWGPVTLFYDTYAALNEGEDFHINYKLPTDVRKGLWEYSFRDDDGPKTVDSCFSGFAVYKIPAILPKDVFYDMSNPDENLECEHVRLNKKIRGKKIIDPKMVNLLLLND